ncbi:MAG TPA: hypothetical protein VF184_00455 [Phycisphaeraceae bacterium]
MVYPRSTDASVARVLAELPPFQRWQNRPLPRQLRQTLHELDQQTLMSLAAHVLQRIVEQDPLPPSRAGYPLSDHSPLR